MLYNTRMSPESLQGEFRPLLIPRRGEFYAWLCVLLVAVVWLLLGLRGEPVFALIPLAGAGLSVAALLISLGNWVDRHTLISLDGDGITFANGLRTMRLIWRDISQVRVFDTNWGKRVQVYGGDAYFTFRTLGEVDIMGKIQGRMGFENGDQILRQIILSSGLSITDRTGEGYYYVRQ